MTFAQRIGVAAFKKAIRAQQSHLMKEKHQLESIQIDLGVDLMTGNVLREKVNHEFKNKKDFERTVETLANVPIEQRGSKQLQEAIKIVKKMEFF